MLFTLLKTRALCYILKKMPTAFENPPDAPENGENTVWNR